MKKNFILWLAASAVVILALPWLAVTLVKGDAGMAVCFLLFFAINPIYFVVTGIFAGKDMKHLWSLPVISAVLFLIGTWVFFEMGETAFILYAVVYLVLGIPVYPHHVKGVHQLSAGRVCCMVGVGEFPLINDHARL